MNAAGSSETYLDRQPTTQPHSFSKQDRGDAPSLADHIPHATGSKIPPNLWLEHATRFSAETLAQREGVQAKAINGRTLRAVRVIAQRDGRAEEDIMFEVHKKQLENGVIRDRAELIKISNKAAGKRLASNEEWKREPHSILDKYPCAFADGFCIGHIFCAERHWRNSENAHRPAGGSRDPPNSPVHNDGQHDLTLQGSSLGPDAAVRQFARDPRMSIGFLINATEPSTALSPAPARPTTEKATPDSPASLTLPHRTRSHRFNEDPNVNTPPLDKMHVGMQNNTDFDSGKPLMKPLLRYKEGEMTKIRVIPDREQSRAYSQTHGCPEDPVIIDD